MKNNSTINCIKAAPLDNINFGFQICNGVVYPADHDSIIKIKKNIFLIQKDLDKTQTNYLYT